MLLLGHLKLGDEIGDLIRSFATHLQLHIGSKTPFSLLKFSLYEKWIDQPFWLTTLWSFLNRANASLDIENHWLPTLARASNQMLMDLALQLTFNYSQLRQLNACRLYLQVLTVSDISTADGCYLLPSACNGNKEEHRISKLQWPNSVRPTNWSAWNRLLQHIGTGDRLSTPLGQWLVDPHQQWSWFFAPAIGSLQERPRIFPMVLLHCVSHYLRYPSECHAVWRSCSMQTPSYDTASNYCKSPS
jgi:hypothetical protein